MCKSEILLLILNSQDFIRLPLFGLYLLLSVSLYIFSEHVKVLNLSSLTCKPVYVCLYLNPVLRQLCDLQPHSNLKCMTCISNSNILAGVFLRVAANGF